MRNKEHNAQDKLPLKQAQKHPPVLPSTQKTLRNRSLRPSHYPAPAPCICACGKNVEVRAYWTAGLEQSVVWVCLWLLLVLSHTLSHICLSCSVKLSMPTTLRSMFSSSSTAITPMKKQHKSKVSACPLLLGLWCERQFLWAYACPSFLLFSREQIQIKQQRLPTWIIRGKVVKRLA